VLTAVWVDVTTLIDVAVLVAPGTVEVIVDAGAVEVIVAVLVAPAPLTVVVVVLREVVVIVAVVVAGPVVGTRVAGGRLSVANPVFGGCALSCELTTTEYEVAFRSVGSVPMLSGPVQTFVVVE